MGKNSNYHRADVALLRTENEALKEKNALLEKQLAQQTQLLQKMSAQMEDLKR